ncbi:MAG: cupredoxin domain-containing protein [Pseudomonadota bacterium]
MTVWLVNLAGLAVIAFIVWWFWLSRPALKKVASGVIDIVVDHGVYTPARIEVSAGKPVTLRFLRQDASPCAEKVVFDSLGISEDLPLNKPREVRLPPLPSGELEFTCQMRMYRGTLVVAAARRPG